jgi:ABC-type branched-subunit amino acid transport system substrate-binding protein
MNANGAVAVRTRRRGGRASWISSFVVLAAVVAALTLPINVVTASAQSGAATGPPVKVGMITAVTGPIAANPDVKDALLASIAAFNKRGGAGKNHAKIQADVCDTKGDANGEVACARQMVNDGVVATLDDLTYNNPAGVVDVLQGAGIPRIGLGPTDISEFQSSVSYPISAGIIAAYLGTAVGFKQDNNTKICLIRTDAPTGATFRGFLTPSFNAIGVTIICDVTVQTGATDYSPYIAEAQRSNPDAILISHSDSVTTQLIGAMQQLNAKIPLGGNPGSFTQETLKKYSDLLKGTVLSESYPYPSAANVKNFPGLKQYFADMKASGKKNLQPANLKASNLAAWVATLGFVNVTKDLDTFTPASVVQALQTVKNVDMMGLTPPWTPSTPGFSVFKSSSNHYVYVSRWNGKAVVTDKTPIDVTQYLK